MKPRTTIVSDIMVSTGSSFGRGKMDKRETERKRERERETERKREREREREKERKKEREIDRWIDIARVCVRD